MQNKPNFRKPAQRRDQRPVAPRPPRPQGGPRSPDQTGGRFSSKPAPGKPQGAPSRPGDAPRAPVMPKSNANPRQVALNVVCDVLSGEAYAALSLDERLSAVNLNQLDRRLCASIVYRTLENLLYIDFALAVFLRAADSLDPRVRNVLRTAACQILLHDRVPDSAAVNEAVKLVKAIHMEPFAGMTNAVLRRLSDGKGGIPWPDASQGATYLSVMYSLPPWLAELLISDYGMDTALAIAAYRTEKHFITIRPTHQTSDEAFDKLLARKAWETEPGALPRVKRVYGAMQIARDTDYINGLFSIQGEGSMIAAEAMAAKRGMSILDCCAAPGGKTAYMAERLDGTGRIYAWDVHEHRVDLIRACVKRLHLENVRCAVRDATLPRQELFGTLDAVLLDAPCTGIGVMDDKPDIKYRVTKPSLDALTETQARLLDACCDYVRPGGALVYSTCSLLKDENERQIERFLSEHPAFIMDALPPAVPERFRGLAGERGLQLLPFRDGVEGFFVARMKRRTDV